MFKPFVKRVDVYMCVRDIYRRGRICVCVFVYLLFISYLLCIAVRNISFDTLYTYIFFFFVN